MLFAVGSVTELTAFAARLQEAAKAEAIRVEIKDLNHVKGDFYSVAFRSIPSGDLSDVEIYRQSIDLNRRLGNLAREILTQAGIPAKRRPFGPGRGIHITSSDVTRVVEYGFCPSPAYV